MRLITDGPVADLRLTTSRSGTEPKRDDGTVTSDSPSASARYLCSARARMS
jgi:hypothetical protein